MTLETFAKRVKAAAARVPSAGRVGAKAWIHATWAIGQFDETLDEFKALLVEANAARLLDLVRCDLVEAFDRFDVRRSRVEARGAEFNFIRI